jgi:EAL domain-containing protein (putative c-di-GMP-specific phosphodiesterase class I)
MQDDLAKTYMEIMSEYNVPPHRINLEITETAAVNSKTTLKENMNSLLAYGNTFSLDDYGTGYSNLIYIIQMPLHIIKIDRTLALSYMESLKAKTATEYTVEMAHALGLKIVVEGIETEEQYLAFKKLGVEYIQGYYFSKPLSKERVLSFVQEWL